MGGLRGWEWIVIGVLVVGLFGLPKLPSVAKSVGKSLRILRDEAKGVASDESGDDASGDDKARGKA